MSLSTKVLVVDDSIAIVNSLVAILGISGFEVDTAFNASDALRKIHNNAYDVVVCDIEMPGLTGLEFLSKVRTEFGRELDVILMTGYLEHDYFIEAIRLGASDFIRKPIDTKLMIRSIRELVQRKRSRSDLADFYTNLDRAEFSFVMSPQHFSKYALSKIFSTYLRQSFKVAPKAMNELLVCVDEMVYNAFIHGTLKLTVDERAMDHNHLKTLIEDKLKEPDISAKRIKLNFSVDNSSRCIEISVEDEGEGFDYKYWLAQAKQEPIAEIEGHGRGIAMLYHLCECLEFSEAGRKVKVRKHLGPDSHNEAV